MENEHLILHSAMEANILPITSACDARCVFCSHKDNPPGIRTVSMPPRSLDEIAWTLRFLNGQEKITIGESATSIIEGEPLCHPDFMEIIRLVREKFPATPVHITTNGHGLDDRLVAFLKTAMPIVINLSLNSGTVEGRERLMGDNRSQAEKAINGVKLLRQYQLPFHGSIVAMPHLIGWEDVTRTVHYLAANQALGIRIFMPGYSKRAPRSLKFDTTAMHRDLAELVSRLAQEINCPLVMEPPLLSDLTPVVAGIVNGSLAYKSGLRRGDVIKTANGLAPRSRVEAWNMLQQPGPVKVEASRNGQYFEVEWDNGEGGGSGAVMEYDFDMRRLQAMEQSIQAAGGKAAVLSSEFGFAVLTSVVKLMSVEKGLIQVLAVKNNLFGGSIKAAGLLTVSDFVQAIEDYCLTNKRPDIVLIPQEAFDCQGYDLLGRPYSQLSEVTGIAVKVI
ncbi:DUF512 domain-containing protein [Sporomusa aerivorans]|uniref:DUF512 domain-containing protein n=1 Tax=Sporomusa aerivorans TaxID=204936 RepID=UPI00352ABB25